MSGVLVGEVLDHAERLRAIGALGGSKVAHRNLLALLVVAEGCREKTRAGHVPQARVARAIGGVARTASRALADLSSAGLISVVQKGNRTEGGGRPTLYRLADLRAIDTTLKVSGRSDENDTTPKVSGRSEDDTRSTRHLDPIDTTFEADRHDTLGVTLPVKDLPEKNYGSFSHLSNAHARDPENDDSIEAEMPDSDRDPLAWINRSLPEGFRVGERVQAEQLLDEGRSGPGTLYAILKTRRAKVERKRATAGGRSA